jgi:tetratricopeptide (TPR) repeat protein
MGFNDIERLKEKIERDPNSKLFVPLAEEYKKAGKIEEAMDVLLKGLERHPNYMSARVSLGKIYLEKGMLNEASQEFEKVASVIPDNLYAHKKLAEIYESLDNKNRAIEELKIVLRLNPIDEIAAKTLASLEESLMPAQKIKKTEEVSPEVKLLETKGTVEIETLEEPRMKIRDADNFIAQGRYLEALDTYRKILSFEPDNRYVLQRVEELKALLKLLGKGEEDLISRLNNLLNGIKKRRNEFFSTS